MFYDAHFTVDVTNWSRGIWLDGTTQIMDREDILLSDHLVPAYLPEFPDDRRSANEGLASMVGVAKIYDRILTLADEHGLHVDGGRVFGSDSVVRRVDDWHHDGCYEAKRRRAGR